MFDAPAAAASVDLDAYFARIGYTGPRTPDLATLRALQALHPATIPFEAIDVVMGRGVDLAPQAIDAKLIHGGRGGYCFEQNALFARVLTALGFQVQGLLGRVRWGVPPDATPRPRTHMALRVELEGRSWLADVGFGGCVLTAPLTLTPHDVQATDHDTYRLLPIPHGFALEVRREAGWLPVYDVGLEPAETSDYEMGNWFTSTHPASHFRNLYAGLTTPEARYGLMHNHFSVRPPGGPTVRESLDAAGIERVLTEVFGLPVQPDWRPLFPRAVETGAALGI